MIDVDHDDKEHDKKIMDFNDLLKDVDMNID